MGAAAYSGYAHAESHDERHGHGAGGRASGIESDADEEVGHEGGAGEYRKVTEDEQELQRELEDDAPHGHGHEKAHADTDDADECHGSQNRGYACDLRGQYLNVRFGDGDDEADEEAYSQHEGQTAPGCESGTDFLPYGEYADVGAHKEEAESENEECRAGKEARHIVAKRGDGEVEQENEKNDRHDRNHRFPAFFEKEHPCPLLKARKTLNRILL